MNDGRPREEHSFWGVINDPTDPVVQPDTVVSGLSDRVTWYHRNVHSIWQDTLTEQSLDHLIGSSIDPALAVHWMDEPSKRSSAAGDNSLG